MSEASNWMLAPGQARIEGIDRTLRERLAKSIAYVGDVAAERGNTRLDGLDRLRDRLTTATVSPWLFCLFSQLVAALSKGRYDEVRRVFADMVMAESLSPAPGVLALNDAGIPQTWWDQFLVLLDTDPQRNFRPKAPDDSDFLRCRDDIAKALALLATTDPESAEEVATLLRMIVLGSPAGSTADDRFNGASTFFVWGGALLNAAVERRVVETIDLVVHEASHVLLFGLSAEGALTRNSGDERHTSPIRADKRPIDGILHACFVTTRVCRVMTRLLAGGNWAPAMRRMLKHRCERTARRRARHSTCSSSMRY